MGPKNSKDPQEQNSTNPQSLLNASGGSNQKFMEPITSVYLFKPKERDYSLKTSLGVIPKGAKVTS